MSTSAESTADKNMTKQEKKERKKADKLNKKGVPTKKMYTLGEEIFNSVSHGVGALLSVAALVLVIVAAIIGGGSTSAVVSAIIYGITLIILYMSSTLYHAIAHPTAKKVFRVFDHSSIFLLIAGTYTPLTLVILKDTSLGIIMFGVLWGLAILGIVLNSISIEKFKVVSMILYICMGWAAIFTVKPILNNLAAEAFILIILGGVAYTGGLLFYGLNRKFKYMHSIWHLFVLTGSILHFFAVILFIYN